MALITENDFSQLFFSLFFIPFCPLISFFFHFFVYQKLSFHWSSVFLSNCDEMSVNCGGTDLDTRLYQFWANGSDLYVSW